jgi:hypothetical protein
VPRTWGYIIIGVAAMVAVGALLLPLPESIDIEPPAAPAVKKPPKPVPPPPPPSKPTHKQKAKPAPAPPKTFPRDDTTKTRTLMQPSAQR